MAIARDHLGRDGIGLEAEAAARDALDLGVDRGIGADRAGELADAARLKRAFEPLTVTVELERPARELPPERGRLRMDAVRPTDADGAPVLEREARDGGDRAVDTSEQERARIADLQRECCVDDVRRGQPVVHPPTLGAEALRDGVDERREIMVGRLLDLGDALGRRHDRVGADPRDVGGGHGANLRPPVERGELHVEPARELALLRPDPTHLRAGVAGDHLGQCSGRPGELEGAPESTRDAGQEGGETSARIRAASTAAFFALSTPTVATGTPGGIWTIERSASRPSSTDFDERSGTPTT